MTTDLDRPDLDFRSPPPSLPDDVDGSPPRHLLACFNDGECQAWVAAILAMRARRSLPEVPRG
ncbi:MAG TPA: hypothetical protein VF422_07835 [Dokdonella sp.]